MSNIHIEIPIEIKPTVTTHSFKRIYELFEYNSVPVPLSCFSAEKLYISQCNASSSSKNVERMPTIFLF